MIGNGIQVKNRAAADAVVERRSTEPTIGPYLQGRLVALAQIAFDAPDSDSAADSLGEGLGKRFGGKTLTQLTAVEAGRVEAGLLREIAAKIEDGGKATAGLGEAPFSFNAHIMVPLLHPDTGEAVYFAGQITCRALTGAELRANIADELTAILAVGGGPSVRPGGPGVVVNPVSGGMPNQTAVASGKVCNKCGGAMVQKQRQDGSGSWWACPRKNEDGSWCGGKPRT